MSIRKTNAVVFTAERKVEIQEIALPEMGPKDILIEIEYSGISIGTERCCLTGKMHEPGQPLMTPFPHIAGYQAGGIVLEVGSQITRVKPGDRVFSIGSQVENWKGSCWAGHAAHHLTTDDYVIKLADNVSTKEAANLVLAQVGYNGATRPWLDSGDPVVIIGEGLVGQFAGQVFRSRGARVLMSGLIPSRLELAAKYSADEVFDAGKVDFPAIIRERYPDGVAVALDATGRISMVRAAVKMLKYGGQLVLNGYYPEGDCLLDIHWVRSGETTIHCPNATKRDRMEKAQALISKGAMHVAELTTNIFPYTEASKAYQLILGQSTDYLGILLNWKP
jgi:2-desacetyl-2-hydroxyethyl bacteriochlorophyllide A dehydrogenase